MAATRETNGLQAAVIIFFLLVVILAVLTYVFFKSASDLKKKVASLEQQTANANTAAREAQDEANKLKEMIGYKIEDKLGAIEANFKEDMKTHGATFPEESRRYRPILEAMSRQLADVTQREAASLAREQALKDRLAAIEKTKDQQIAEFKQQMDKLTADLAAERGKFNTERGRLTGSAGKLQAELASTRKTAATQTGKLKDQLRKANTRIQRTVGINEELGRKLREREAAGHENPDGRVTWVNQRTRMAWVNLGEGDFLKRHLHFSVFPVDANNLAQPEKKGSIEITRIIGPHMAEARIIEDDPSRPILPGDKIHSPVWQSGVQTSFALAGFLDIDGDNESDREKIRDIIELNGGKVVMEQLEDGKTQGELTVNTRYLVLGEKPDAGTKQQVLAGYSKIIAKAQELGIERMPIGEFIAQMGWHADDRTVQLGRAARPEDFKATFPHGVQPRSYGSTSKEFQKRERPHSTF